MNESSNYNGKSINSLLIKIIGVFVALLVLAGGYYLYSWYRANENPPTQQQSALNNAFLEAQQLDPSGASAMYEQLAKQESDPFLRARYSILQAWQSNNAGNYEVGIPLLKAVVADPVMPDEFKAEALIAMLQVYLKGQTEPLQMIFGDGGIYAEALGEGDINDPADLAMAVNNLYKTADSYHQYAFTSYMRAHFASRHLLSNPQLSEVEREETVSAIQTLLEQGDALLDAELQSGLYTHDKTNIIREFFHTSMHLRLFALEALARNDESYRSVVEEYYDFVMESFSEYDHAAIQSVKSYVRFYYAAYLVDVYGDARGEEIREVMAPIYEAEGEMATVNAYSVWPFFERELSRSPEDISIETTYIQLVAEHDPDFAEFLTNEGWLDEQ